MIEAPHTYHALYMAVYAAHANAPQIWTNHHCTRLLTSIMSSKPFSWRVVGITKEALKKLHELNYRYKSREGLTRAHCVLVLKRSKSCCNAINQCPSLTLSSRGFHPHRESAWVTFLI